MMDFTGFTNGAYTLDDRDLTNQECINFYPEKVAGKWILTPTGGYEDLIDFDNGGNIRALYRTTRAIGTTDRNNNGSIIVVCGAEVIWYKEDKTFQVLGIISDVLNQIDIVDDGIGIIIADGTQMYRIEMTTLDFSVVDFDAVRPTKLAVLNFRTICCGTEPDGSDVNSNRFYYSDTIDNSSWAYTQSFEMANTREPIINVASDDDRLYLFTKNAYQIWASNTSITKPFKKEDLGLKGLGLYAKDSVCSILGVQYAVVSVTQGSPMIYAISGSSIGKISTPAIDRALAKYDVDDCTSYTFSDNGHSFVIFNFDEMNKTLCYDVDMKEWHTRAYRNDLGEMHRWQQQYVTSYGGDIIMGSRDESKLYNYSNKIYTQSDSGEILRLRTSPNLKDMFRKLTTSRLTLDMMVGRGIEGSFKASTLMMRYSYDGGYSWSSRRTLSLGEKGDYSITPEFTSLGTGKALTVEVSISDNCNCSIHGVSVHQKTGTRRG